MLTRSFSLSFFLAFALLAMPEVSFSQGQKQKPTPVKGAKQDPIKARVEAILKTLTLQQKVGQMAQITLDVIGKGDNRFASSEPFALDSAKCKAAFFKFGVGSVLNAPNNTARTKEWWYEVIGGIQGYALKAPSKIPVIYGIDAIHGATYTAGSTLFPQQIAQAATRNRALVKRGAEIMAYETRASSTPWTFSPVLDLGLDPRSPRHWETYGEDPYLAGEMGRSAIKGYEGDKNDIGSNVHVASCAKHFVGYQVPVSGKDRTNAYISADALAEYHLPSFKAGLQAGGAHTLMVNSGLVNNFPVHANQAMLTGLLKRQLGFEGLVVTDWGDIENLVTRDKLAKDHKEAIEMGINAGIDMSMVPYNYEQFCDLLVELVKEGKVSQARIDDAVRRILRIKVKAGLFERPTTNPKDYPLFGSPAYEKASYDAAAEAITLLKNQNNLLPLSPGKRILVAGPNANSMRTLDGAWSYSWQGDKVEQFAKKYHTILKGIQTNAGEATVTYFPAISYKAGGKYYEEAKDQWDETIAAANTADVIVLCLGENTYVEKPGDLNDLYLSDLQTELAQKLSATGKPIVLVLNEGRPRVISKIEPGISAIVQAYLPGNFGGDAVADVLFGKVNPSGRLPYTYPRYPNSLANYIHKYADEQKKSEGAYDYEADFNPQFEFGAGLSYTTFSYANLTTNKNTFTFADTILVKIEVTNTGQREGKVAVELYTSDLVASKMAPDMRRLRGFEKIALTPGEKQSVLFKLPAADLAYADKEGNPVKESGAYAFKIGGQEVKLDIIK